MKIVLTGATGYIGGHIAEKLIQNGHEVYCIVRPTSDISKLPQGVQTITIGRNIELYETLAEVKPEVVVHVAGVFLGRHSKETIEQMLQSNVVFSTILLDAACEAGCQYFINTSSYWQNYNLKNYNPVNLYAATKQAFEDVIRYYIADEKVTVMDLQLFDVFGPKDPRKKVLNLVAALRDGDDMQMSPGEQKLYMCYIEDVVAAYMHTLDEIVQKPVGVYEKWAVRAEKPYTLKEIVDKYLKIAGKDVSLHWGGLDYRKREIMNPEGIGKVLAGWKPQYTLEEGLKKYCEEG